MQAVTKNPRDAMVVAKVLRRNSSITGLGEYFLKKTNKQIYSHFFLAEEIELEQLTDPITVNIESSYRGPHVHLPIDKGDFEALILAFQRGEV
jgi:hypothetical protein